ncbi:MAG: hypothetical protein ABIQ86_10360 [Steroidobacteraceae bacterium]
MVTVTTLDDGPRSGGATGSSSAVSWAAILAGAAAAAALSLILLVLGTGLGLAVVSPWAGDGVSARAISWSTIAWIAFTALASSGLGGYVAGRLRVRWPTVHGDEVYFRDTAHGFLAWAVATLLTAAVLTSAIGAILSAGATLGAAAAGSAHAMSQGTSTSLASPGSSKESQQDMYFVDTLFRIPPPEAPVTGRTVQNGSATGTGAASPGIRAELARIFDNSMGSGPLAAEDTRYAGQLVAQNTGLPQQDAEARVTSTYAAAQRKLQDAEAKARSLADEARKNAAYASLWIFVSLLLGAFFASLMATVGGRRRDLF